MSYVEECVRVYLSTFLERQTGRYRETDRRTDRQTDRQAGRQTGREKDNRQTEIDETCVI